MILTREAWQDAAARAVVDAVMAHPTDLAIDGQDWQADVVNAAGDAADPGELFLTSPDGRQVLARLDVLVIEGTLT